MTKQEKRALLDRYLALYRVRPYGELVAYADPTRGDHYEVTLDSGGEAYIDVQGLWDDEVGGNVRISVSVYDHGWSAFFPAMDDFIIAPDGSFIGEG